MRVGVFGGSFNPPHTGHLIIAELVRDEFDLDEVLWVPSSEPPHKRTYTLAPAADRLAMVKLATAGNPHFRWSDAELRRPGPSYTVDTLRLLLANRPHADWYLIVGGDSLADFSSWKDPSSILRAARMIVYRRTNYGAVVPDEHSDRIFYATGPLIAISSSGIRERVRGKKSTRYLLPESVREYIAEKGLYDSMGEAEGDGEPDS